MFVLFVTYQPFDFENMKRSEEWKDTYANQLGYNPVYAVNAETLLSAQVESLLAQPTIPEQAIFFKTKDFRFISTTEHVRYLEALAEDKEISFDRGNFSLVMSPEKMRKIWPNINPLDIFRDDSSIGKHEFLINPSDMKIIESVNIKQTFMNALNSEELSEADDIIKQCTTAAIESYQDVSLKYTSEEMWIRGKVAKQWFDWYVTNDCFMKDYKRIIGMRDGDKDISIDNLNQHRVFRLKDWVIFDETKITRERLKNYIIESIIKD